MSDFIRDNGVKWNVHYCDQILLAPYIFKYTGKGDGVERGLFSYLLKDFIDVQRTHVMFPGQVLKAFFCGDIDDSREIFEARS